MPRTVSAIDRTVAPANQNAAVNPSHLGFGSFFLPTKYWRPPFSWPCYPTTAERAKEKHTETCRLIGIQNTRDGMGWPQPRPGVKLQQYPTISQPLSYCYCCSFAVALYMAVVATIATQLASPSAAAVVRWREMGSVKACATLRARGRRKPIHTRK